MINENNQLQNKGLERLALDDNFLFELASFFAHKKIRSLSEIPGVITVYTLKNNYKEILERFRDYFATELSKEFGNRSPRVVISKDVEPNTYSVFFDFFFDRRQMPGIPPPIPPNARAPYVYRDGVYQDSNISLKVLD